MRRPVRAAVLAVLLLGLVGTASAAASNPFKGRRLFMDCEFGHTSSGAQYSSWWRYYRARGADKRLLAKIAHVPTAKWFAGIDDIARLHRQVERFVAGVDHPAYGGRTCTQRRGYESAQWQAGPARGRARDRYAGTLPVIAIRALHKDRCRGWSGGPWASTANNGLYKRWIRAFVAELGRTWRSSSPYVYSDSSAPPRSAFRTYRARRAAVIVEPDALGLIGPYPKCLTATGKRHVKTLIRYAVNRLRRLPHVAAYIDVGAADWMTAGAAVKLLRAAGVRHARGFALNATHFDGTRNEIRFGNRVARKLHKHFVVNTAENGRRLKAGENCNPPRAGLGPLPTAHTRSRWVDALLWISRPGLSSNYGNRCHRGPTTNVWFPAHALSLARHAAFRTAPWPSRLM